MKQPRTIKIVRLLSDSISSVLRGDKLVINHSSARLEELGGIYIKFLQLLVINLDPQNQTGYKQLLNVYENSQPDDINIYDYLSKQLPAASVAQFRSIEKQPFATGSFGQVYRGQLLSGEPVIIKILRPSVRKYLHYDLRLLGLLSWVYSFFDKQKMLNFRGMFKDFKQTSLNETDYIREAAVTDAYYQSYKDHPYLVTPRVYKELSNRAVLVQDYIEGVSVTQLLDMQTSGLDAIGYCQEQLGSNLLFQLKTIGVELFSKAIIGEIVQTDPHPGNILALPNNQVALIDFGMSTYISGNRQALLELIKQYHALYSGQLVIEDFTLASLKCMAPDLYTAITQADMALAETGLSELIFYKLREAITDIFNDEQTRPFIEQLLAQRQIMRILFFGINKGNRFGFSFDLSDTSLWKAVQGYFVMMARFEPSGQTVLQVFDEVIAFGQQHYDLVAGSPGPDLDPNEALETLSYWFDKMARNDPWLLSKLRNGYL